MSLKLKRNDEIIVPDRSWISLLNAINILGLKSINSFLFLAVVFV
jgi:hypothetical protein